jgi:hypothetical protein
LNYTPFYAFCQGFYGIFSWQQLFGQKRISNRICGFKVTLNIIFSKIQATPIRTKPARTILPTDAAKHPGQHFRIGLLLHLS